MTLKELLMLIHIRNNDGVFSRSHVLRQYH